MFSKLVSFFIPKNENFVKKEEIDHLVETVSKGFSTHRDKLDSIEKTSLETSGKVEEINRFTKSSILDIMNCISALDNK
ncbi:MAG: hypothetical protein U9P44_02670, partial [archaeon]|nr:hypothetical protein [archaeon]